MTEAYASLPNIIKYYGRIENAEIIEPGAQIPFNFRLMGSHMKSTANEIVKSITDFIESLPKGRKIHANWLVRNNRSYCMLHFENLKISIYFQF